MCLDGRLTTGELPSRTTPEQNEGKPVRHRHRQSRGITAAAIHGAQGRNMSVASRILPVWVCMAIYMYGARLVDAITLPTGSAPARPPSPPGLEPQRARRCISMMPYHVKPADRGAFEASIPLVRTREPSKLLRLLRVLVWSRLYVKF